MFAALLYLGSGIGLWITSRALRTKILGDEAPLRRADVLWLVAVVASGGVVGPVLLLIGLAVTPASSASLLLNLEGVFTLVIAWVVFRENVDWRVGTGAGCIVVAAAILSWSGPAGAINLGALAIAGACLAWAIDNNLTRKLSGTDPVTLAMIKGLGAGTFNAILSVWLAAAWPSVGRMASAAGVGFVAYGLSLVCFILALRHLGTARTSAYFSLAPFVGTLVAVGLFGDPVTWTLAAAAALMGVGLYFHLTERHEHVHEHEAMSHDHRHIHDEHHQHEHGPQDPAGEPHTHWHEHAPLTHSHPHYPDLHHRHPH